MSVSAVACKVGEFMTPDPMVLDATDTVGTAARMFEQHDFSGAPVIGARGEVIGMISKTDLICHALRDRDERPPRYLFEPADDDADSGLFPDELPVVLVEEVMTTEPVTGRPAETVFEVARRMVDCRIHRVIIVDESACPVGIVTALDLLRAMTELPRLLREITPPSTRFHAPPAAALPALRRGEADLAPAPPPERRFSRTVDGADER